MVKDSDQKALQNLSRDYAAGGLPQQEYRRKRSEILDHLSNPTGPTASERARLRKSYRRSAVFVTVALLLAFTLLGLTFWL